jgi:poly(3-hydroxybutyrate) depolymerase
MLENLCVEQSAIFGSGFSNGGSMIFNISCEIPQYFAGLSFTG